MAKKEIIMMEQKLTTQVMSLGKERGITFPKGYNPQNALMSAMLIIKQDKKLQSCDQISIAESLLKMVTMGLDASANQCYLIPYGNQAKLSVSYFGTQTLLRRIPGIKDVIGQAIFDGDDVDYDVDLGNIINFKHKTTFSNRKNEVIGAYCVIKLDEEIYGRSEHIEVMDIAEVKQAWGQGATKGSSPAHKNFPQEMSKKAVINRACKNFINTLRDGDETNNLVSTYNSVTSDEYESIKVQNENREDEVIEQDLSLIDDTTIVDDVIIEDDIVDETPNETSFEEFDF